MANFHLTNKAVADLAQIWDYTFEEYSELKADIYYNELLIACKKITQNPNIGKKYTTIIPDLFGVHKNRHIIFFRIINADLIEITRICTKIWT